MLRATPGHIRFQDGTQVTYDQPRNTLDPRNAACSSHRPACDCREAEIAEQLHEYRGEEQLLRRTIAEILRGHPDGCMCTGCQIARAMGLSFVIAVENYAPRIADIRS